MSDASNAWWVYHRIGGVRRGTRTSYRKTVGTRLTADPGNASYKPWHDVAGQRKRHKEAVRCATESIFPRSDYGRAPFHLQRRSLESRMRQKRRTPVPSILKPLSEDHRPPGVTQGGHSTPHSTEYVDNGSDGRRLICGPMMCHLKAWLSHVIDVKSRTRGLDKARKA